ncbi:hypothetical protein D3C77_393450 [compost metagenome]
MIAFAPGGGRWQVAARCGLVRLDAVGKAGEVRPSEQLRDRVGDVIRVAQQAAVAVGPAQDLQHVMAALHGLGALPRQALEHGQALGQGDAAGRRRRGTDQFALVGQLIAQRLTRRCAVVGQVIQAPDSACRLHAVDHGLGGRAGIEAVAALAGQAFEGDRQLRLADLRAQGGHFALLEEQAGAFRIVAQGGQAHGGPVTVDAVDGKALIGQADGRGQGAFEREFAVVRGEVGQRRRQARNGGGQRAIDRQPRLDLVVLEVHGLAGLAGGSLAGIEKGVPRRVVCLAQEEKATAAQSRAIGLDHRQRCTDGNGRVEGVTALFEDFPCGRRGLGVRAGNRRLPRPLCLCTRGP